MGEHHNFEEMEIWKRSSRLTVVVLILCNEIKLYALRDQMCRASISAPSNIAEGAERESNREFRRYLAIAKASLGELRTQLYIGIRAEVLDAQACQPLIQETKTIAAMIESFRKRPNTSIIQKAISLFC
jgi:four helix bundle protein